MLDIDDVRRKTALLIPGDHIRGSLPGHAPGVAASQLPARDIGEADAVAIAEKAGFGGHPLANRRQRFIAARGGDAIRRVEERGFQLRFAAAPLGHFEAGAQLGLNLIKRMRKEAGQQGTAAGALHKLRRADQHAQHHGRKRRVRQGARGDMHQQIGAGRQAGAM